MNKTELIAAVASKCSISKKEAEAVVLATFDSITNALVSGEKVLDGQQLLDFMEIIEDRHGQKATIMISQLPVSDWYDVMKGNTTAADAILDRLVHTSVRFELKYFNGTFRGWTIHTIYSDGWDCRVIFGNPVYLLLNRPYFAATNS